jgi:hypothetical protein
MKNNSLFLFKNQTGGGSNYYSQGATAAVNAFQQGGVNALLAFLAAYSPPAASGGGDPTSGFEQG